MNQPKVFVVQEPMRRDRLTQRLEPFMDLSPAAAYGDLEVLLKSRAVPLSGAPLIEKLRVKLKDFSSNDFLVLVGDTTLIAAAVLVAGKINHGSVNVLKWNRETASYIKTRLAV